MGQKSQEIRMQDSGEGGAKVPVSSSSTDRILKSCKALRCEPADGGLPRPGYETSPTSVWARRQRLAAIPD